MFMRVGIFCAFSLMVGCGSSTKHDIQAVKTKRWTYFQITDRVWLGPRVDSPEALKNDLNVNHLLVIGGENSIFDKNEISLDRLKSVESQFHQLKGSVLVSSVDESAAVWLAYHFRFSHSLPVSESLLRGEAAGLQELRRATETFLYLHKPIGQQAK